MLGKVFYQGHCQVIPASRLACSAMVTVCGGQPTVLIACSLSQLLLKLPTSMIACSLPQLLHILLCNDCTKPATACAFFLSAWFEHVLANIYFIFFVSHRNSDHFFYISKSSLITDSSLKLSFSQPIATR